MKTLITQREWLSFDKYLREKLKLVFMINRSEGMSVSNGQITSDGCSQDDLTEGVTIGKMIEYLGEKWDKKENDKLFDDLLKKVIKKINEETKTSVGEGDTGTKKEGGKGKGTKGKGKGVAPVADKTE